jgi:hypothetical protein
MRLLILLMIMAWAHIGHAQDPNINPRKRDSLIQSIEANRKVLQASQDSFISQQGLLYDSTQRAAGREETINKLNAVNEKGNVKNERQQDVARLAIGLLLLTAGIIVVYRWKKKGSGS